MMFLGFGDLWVDIANAYFIDLRLGADVGWAVAKSQLQQDKYISGINTYACIYLSDTWS